MLLLRGLPADFDHWVFGDSFLRPFYQIYDMDNYRIGLGTNKMTLGNKYKDLIKIENTTDYYIIAGKITLFILVFLGISYLILRRYRRKSKVTPP